MMAKGIVMDLFNQPTPKRIGNPEAKEDDPPGDQYREPRIPFISLVSH
jgi:hypothetical protein